MLTLHFTPSLHINTHSKLKPHRISTLDNLKAKIFVASWDFIERIEEENGDSFQIGSNWGCEPGGLYRSTITISLPPSSQNPLAQLLSFQPILFFEGFIWFQISFLANCITENLNKTFSCQLYSFFFAIWKSQFTGLQPLSKLLAWYIHTFKVD